MITNERCQQIYTAIFSIMIANNALSLPLHTGDLCNSLGIELCPLSDIVSGTGLSEGAIFDIWGNKDGAVMQSEGHNPATRTIPEAFVIQGLRGFFLQPQ